MKGCMLLQVKLNKTSASDKKVINKLELIELLLENQRNGGE